MELDLACCPIPWPTGLSLKDKRIYFKDLNGGKLGDSRLQNSKIVVRTKQFSILLRQRKDRVMFTSRKANTCAYTWCCVLSSWPCQGVNENRLGHSLHWPCFQVHPLIIVYAILPSSGKNILHCVPSIVHSELTAFLHNKETIKCWKYSN